MESDRERRKLKAREAAEKAQAESSLTKSLNLALQKDPCDRTAAENSLIRDNPTLACSIEKRIELRTQKRLEAEARSAEVEDSPEELEAKLQQLCQLIKDSAAACRTNRSESTKRAPTTSPGERSPDEIASACCKAETQEHSLGLEKTSSVPENSRSHVSGLSQDSTCSQTSSDAYPKYAHADSGPRSDDVKEQHGFSGRGVVVHTGAGLSTPAGIPDFRGPNGVWTLQAKGQQTDQCMGLSYEKVVPTRGHMVLAAFHQQGLVKHFVSQNVDGLHLRSGVPKSSLSEIHGCVFREQCKTCGRKYPRPFDVTVPQGSAYHRHKTGRLCGQDSATVSTHDRAEAMNNKTGEDHPPKSDGMVCKADSLEEERPPLHPGSNNAGCGGPLVDTIVHFNEMLDPDELSSAEENATGADLALCLGSSFKVPPANRLPRLAKRLVIVNLQWTPLDKYAFLKIHGRLDTVLARMAELLRVPWSEYTPALDPLLGEKLLSEGKAKNTAASTLFMRQATARDDSPSETGKKRKKRKSSYTLVKKVQRISFPRPGKG